MRAVRNAILGLLVIAAITIGLNNAVMAQSVQPTGQTSPQTQNPQVPVAPNLNATPSSLQSSTSQQVLGTSTNQFSGPLQIGVSRNANIVLVPKAPDNPLDSSQNFEPNTNGYGLSKLIVGFVGCLTIILGLVAISVASKRKPV